MDLQHSMLQQSRHRQSRRQFTGACLDSGMSPKSPQAAFVIFLTKSPETTFRLWPAAVERNWIGGGRGGRRRLSNVGDCRGWETARDFCRPEIHAIISDHGLGDRIDAELGINLPDVGLDCESTDVEVRRVFLRPKSQGVFPQHLLFAPTQSRRFG